MVKNKTDKTEEKKLYDTQVYSGNTGFTEDATVIHTAENNTIITENELQEKIVQPDWTSLDKSFSDLNVIGMGGMGKVFSAKDTLFYRNVALKIMRKDIRRRHDNVDAFIREARITAQIDHPNIIPVYNLGIFKEVGPYFSMKKVEGETLGSIIRRLEEGDKKLEEEYTLRRKLNIFINICNGVAFAHSKGVIHCDLKPGNIMLGNYGEVFIMDWGMAVYRSQDDLSEQHSRIDLGDEKVKEFKKYKVELSNIVNGTPAFMAPEQIFGQKEAIDRQTDVYALGVILYTLLTCTQSPFPPKLPAEEIFDRALSGNFPPPRKRAPKRRISGELEIVCLKAMSPYKHERYKNVEELMVDIRNVLEMRPIEVYQSPFTNFIKYCLRHPMIPTAVIGCLLTLGVFYSYFFFSEMLQANTLFKVMQMTIDEISPEYIQSQGVFRYENNMPDAAKAFFADENMEIAVKNTRKKLDQDCRYLIDTMVQLNGITNNSKYRDIVERSLYFCIHYSLHTQNSENIKKLQMLDDGIVEDAYSSMITSNPSLRRELQMLSSNHGTLDFKTSDSSLEVFISKHFENDAPKRDDEKSSQKETSGDVSELLVQKGSFNINLKSGEYSIVVVNKKQQGITIPVYIEAGSTAEVEFDMPEYFPPDCVFVNKGNYYSKVFNHYSDGIKSYTDSFFLLDHEVTIREYLEFYKTVTDPVLKKKYNPDLLLVENGEFVLRKLFNEKYEVTEPYDLSLPVVGINGDSAQAYCDYMSRKLNMKCRLPYFDEMEKAARGAGRRLYVWGNIFNPEYALLNTNSQIRKYPVGAPPKTFKHDYSLYGVYDLCGNVNELVQLRTNKEKFAVYGGSYKNTANYAKINTLSRFLDVRTDIGMRYVVELPRQE